MNVTDSKIIRGGIVDKVISVKNGNFHILSLIGYNKEFFIYFLPNYVRSGAVVDITYIKLKRSKIYLLLDIVSATEINNKVVCPKCSFSWREN